MRATTSMAARPAGWLSRLGGRVADDLHLYGIVAALLLISASVSAALGRRCELHLIATYLVLWSAIGIVTATCGFGFRFAAEAWALEPRHPVAFAWTLGRSFCTPERVAGALLYLSTAIFMASFTTLKMVLPELRPFWADPSLARLDALLHGGRDPWQLMQPLLGHAWVTRGLEVVYGPVWALMVAFVVLTMCFVSDGRRIRFLRAFFALWIVNGLILAALFMSGGPAFYDMLVHDTRYLAITRYLAFDAGHLFSASLAQRLLWLAHTSKASTAGAGISAFPSMHVGMSVLCCAALWGVNRIWSCLVLAIIPLICVATVHLGWHYAVDVYASLILVPIVWWASGQSLRLEAFKLNLDVSPPADAISETALLHNQDGM